MRRYLLDKLSRRTTNSLRTFNWVRMSATVVCFFLVTFNTPMLFATTLTYTQSIPNISSNNGGYPDCDSTISTWLAQIGNTLTFNLTIDNSVAPSFFATPKSLKDVLNFPNDYWWSIGTGTTTFETGNPMNGWSYVTLQSYGNSWDTLYIDVLFDWQIGPGYGRMGFTRQSNGDQYGFAGVYNQWIYVDNNTEVTVSFMKYGSSNVPEPTTLLLLGFGLMGLAGFRRKFKK